MSPSEPDAAPGLRERKRLQTLDLLTRSAYAVRDPRLRQRDDGADRGAGRRLQGTLYNHFPVKEALLAHYFHQELARSARDLLPRLMKLPGFAQRLTKTLHASAHWSEAHRAYMAPTCTIGWRPRSPPPRTTPGIRAAACIRCSPR